MLRLDECGELYRNLYPGDRAIHAFHPRLVHLGGQSVLCIYRRGAAIYADDGRLYQLRSCDGGRSWSDEGCVYDGADDAKPYAYAFGCPTRLRSGGLILAAMRFHRPSAEMPFYNERTGASLPEEVVLMRSSDDGRTWSKPARAELPGAYLEITDGITELNNGEWWVPFDTGKAYNDPVPHQNRVVALRSRDHGATWQGPFNIVGHNSYDKTFRHARVIRLGDGRLFGMLWTADSSGQHDLRLHRVVSDEAAINWELPEETSVIGQTSYPAVLPDGRLLLAYSDRRDAAPGIYAVLSVDEGRSWNIDGRLQVWDAYGRASLGVPRTKTYPSSHDNIAFGAPHAIGLDDGAVLVAFWATVGGLTTCRYARIHCGA